MHFFVKRPRFLRMQHGKRMCVAVKKCETLKATTFFCVDLTYVKM